MTWQSNWDYYQSRVNPNGPGARLHEDLAYTGQPVLQDYSNQYVNNQRSWYASQGIPMFEGMNAIDLGVPYWVDMGGGNYGFVNTSGSPSGTDYSARITRTNSEDDGLEPWQAAALMTAIAFAGVGAEALAGGAAAGTTGGAGVGGTASTTGLVGPSSLGGGAAGGAATGAATLSPIIPSSVSGTAAVAAPNLSAAAGLSPIVPGSVSGTAAAAAPNLSAAAGAAPISTGTPAWVGSGAGSAAGGSSVGWLDVAGDVVGIGASLWGADQQASASKDSAKIIAESAQEARDQMERLNQPYLNLGEGSIGNLVDAVNAPNYSKIFNQDPTGYTFLENNPLFQAAVDHSARQMKGVGAAQGKFNSGGMVKDLFSDYLARGDQFFGTYLSRGDNLTNTAVNRALVPVTIGQNAANFQGVNASSLITGAGSALGAGEVGSANAWANGVGNALGFFGDLVGRFD